MKKIFMILIFIVSICWQVNALDKININAAVVNDAEYVEFIKELGALMSFSQTQPAENLGLVGFEVGINLKVADINENKSYWQNAAGKTTDNRTVYPQLTVTKGLPLNIDISAMYMPVSGSGMAAAGCAVKWSFFEGGALTPAIAMRAAYSTLIKKNNFQLEDINCALSISKGFAVFTPYAIAGINNTKISDIDVSGLSFENKSKSQFNYGAGLKFSVGLININGSVMFYEIPVYSLSAGIGF